MGDNFKTLRDNLAQVRGYILGVHLAHHEDVAAEVCDYGCKHALALLLGADNLVDDAILREKVLKVDVDALNRTCVEGQAREAAMSERLRGASMAYHVHDNHQGFWESCAHDTCAGDRALVDPSKELGS